MDSEFDQIAKRVLLNIIYEQYGTLVDPLANTLPDNISIKMRLTVKCQYNHVRIIPAGFIGEWCEICMLLANQQKFNPGIQCQQNSYIYGQIKFPFICEVGHKTFSYNHVSKRGCRSCIVHDILKKKYKASKFVMDGKCENKHEHSRLRFHCGKLRHNPKCSNPKCTDSSLRNCSDSCDNFVICNQDFYATPSQIKNHTDVYDCGHNHRWIVSREIFVTFRTMEIAFDERFDDSSEVDFTGYNSNLKIAFTHEVDKVPFKALSNAKKWCNDFDVSFIIIPKDRVSASHITTCIVQQLINFGIFVGPLVCTVKSIRDEIHKMDRDNKLFNNKCVVYGESS